MSTLFWINILVGAMLSLLCLLIAPLVVAFYHEPRLFWVTVAMGLGFLFNAAGVQHLALLQRQMRYVTLSANIEVFVSADKSWSWTLPWLLQDTVIGLLLPRRSRCRRS